MANAKDFILKGGDLIECDIQEPQISSPFSMTFQRLSLLFSATCVALFGQGLLTSSAVFAETPSEATLPAMVADDSPAADYLEPLAAPSDVWERIRRGFEMPVLQNVLVDKWVRHYTKDPNYLNRMFNRSGKYLYHIIEEVEARGMPTELALLPFVESAFQPEALSHAKAAGLWQFMPATGKVYSLEQNLWHDERRDVMESTRAALDYFQYLHGLFHDWQLALAAYNWGEGSVQRAIRRAKSARRPTDYSHLKMPRETANYVPKLEAIKRIVADPKRYGIELPDVGNEPFFVTVSKPRDIDTETAAKLADMPLADFKKLNPSFKLPVIVAAHNNNMLLPADKLDGFVDSLANWMETGQPLSQWRTYKLKSGETLASVAKQFDMTEAELLEVNKIPKGRKVLANSTLLVKSPNDEHYDIGEDEADARLRLSPLTTWRRVTYRVRSGDTLGRIAHRWHISTKSIRKDNRLRGDMLRVGQRLTLTVPQVERMPVVAVKSRTDSKSAAQIYAVRKGDTLSSIARRYGVSVAALKEDNRLRSNALKIGQRLRIYTKGTTAPHLNYHVVVAGDTLSGIAAKYHTTVVRLKRANHLRGNQLRIGQRLEIPSGSGAVVEVVKAVEQSVPAPSAGDYRVQKGDSLYSIGQKFGVSVTKLREVNGLSNNRLRIGQRLVIPATAKVHPKQSVSSTVATQTRYRVRKGDSLYVIARRFGVSVSSLKKLNHLKSNNLKIGQTLRIK